MCPSVPDPGPGPVGTAERGGGVAGNWSSGRSERLGCRYHRSGRVTRRNWALRPTIRRSGAGRTRCCSRGCTATRRRRCPGPAGRQRAHRWGGTVRPLRAGDEDGLLDERLDVLARRWATTARLWTAQDARAYVAQTAALWLAG